MTRAVPCSITTSKEGGASFLSRKKTALDPATGGPHRARLAVIGREMTMSGEPLKSLRKREEAPATRAAAV
jgi:hypothetical protein